MPDPLFARPANPDRQTVEVRPQLRVAVVAVLDAVCFNEGGKARQRKIEEIVDAWAIEEARKANVIARCLEGNPPIVDSETA
jgi:hypothetical protein